MEKQYEYVHEKFRHLVIASNQERIEFLDEPRWVGYAVANKIIDNLVSLMNKPKRPRMFNLLVVGDSNNGKTTLIRHFYDLYGIPFVDSQSDGIRPIILAEAPPSANEKELYISLLERFYVPYRPTDSVAKLRYQTIHLFREYKVKMLIIDEFHSLLVGTEPITFTGFYWDKWRLWIYDLDRGFEPIAPQIYEDIRALSFNQQVNLVNHSLYSVLRPINGESTLIKGQAKWVISRGSRNRTFRVGQSYCPCCLGETPYLRNEWRFAWHFGCSKHQVLLESKCPCCGELYQPHLLSAEKRHLNYCHQCGEKLQVVTTPLNEVEIATMETLNNVFMTNSGECFRKRVNAQVYFAILRYFINLIRRATVVKSTHAFAKFVEECGISQAEICQTKTALAFEQLPVEERKNLLVNAIKILKLPSKDFIQAIQQSGITQKAFDFEKYPMELDILFKYAPEGKTVSRKTVTNKPKTDSVLSLNRQWERLKRRLKITA